MSPDPAELEDPRVAAARTVLAVFPDTRMGPGGEPLCASSVVWEARQVIAGLLTLHDELAAVDPASPVPYWPAITPAPGPAPQVAVRDHQALGICWCRKQHTLDEAVEMNGGWDDPLPPEVQATL